MFGLTKTLVLHAAASLDRAVTLAVRLGMPPPEDDAPLDWGYEGRSAFLEALAARYETLGAGEFFSEPPAIEPVSRERGFAARELRRTDLTWPARYEPFLPEIRDRYLATAENQLAFARLFRRDRPRPVAILVHGYLMGRLPLDERIWPIARFDRLGLDTVLVVLPFHGRRGDPARTGRPEFPGRDPRFTNEGFRQVTGELGSLASFLRSEGHPGVGIVGMSLGGYAAALAATVLPKLDFLVPIIPLASLADFAFEQGSLSEAPELRAREHALLERVYSLASPLARSPLIAPERVLVLGGKADRITPLSHARRLAHHFRAPLAAWHGGHLLQLGRSQAFDRIAELVRSAGVVES
ncbi:MAG TPA: alpha/beta hydrolase family protein [Polyangiaceae bacterium]